MKITIGEFLDKYGKALFEKTASRFPPVVSEPRPFAWEGGRRPLGAQALAVSGLVEALRRGERAAFLTAEMGTGKTYMAIRTALELDPKGRFLVLCPPHLVPKWAREAEMEEAKAVVLERARDVRALLGREGPLFAVLSRERAKLGPGWRPAYGLRRTKEGKAPVCPTCGTGLPFSEEELARKRRKCEACGSPLYQEAPPKRESLYHALKRLLPKGFFRLLVLDEAHEYKGGGTAQGLVAAGLMDWVGQALLLTGTLFGGYASNLYHLLKRTVPEVREKFPGESAFVAQYGLYERVYREKEETGYGYYTRRREARSHTRERPGLSPLLLTHLLPRSVFLRLPDVAQDLPPYGEEVVLLDMDPEHEEAYRSFEQALGEIARQALAQGSRRLLGALVQAGIQVPDTTWQEEAVMDDLGAARFFPLPPSYRHAKERRLLEVVEEERRRGRRAIVYVQGTDKRDQLARLEALFRERGIKAALLRADRVKPEEREAWVAAQVRAGAEVLVVHPRVVQTGLDLIDFPTVVWYQPEYSVYTLRQAARRSWRIGQTRPVRVVYLAYRGTLQEAALALIAAKARSSLALEGELVEGGLTVMAQEDPTLALAKALAGATRLEFQGFTLEPEAKRRRELRLEAVRTLTLKKGA